MFFYNTPEYRVHITLTRQIKNELGEITFAGVFIGCSALDWEADEDTINKMCDGIIEADKIRMNSDVYVAYVASGCDSIAICVMSFRRSSSKSYVALL